MEKHDAFEEEKYEKKQMQPLYRPEEEKNERRNYELIDRDKKSQFFEENLAEIKEQIDSAIRSVDENQIESIELGHTEILDNTACLLGNKQKKDFDDNLGKNDGFVVYVAIRFKKTKSHVECLNAESEVAIEIPGFVLDSTESECSDNKLKNENTENLNDLENNGNNWDREASKTIDNFEENAKYGREEANRNGDVGKKSLDSDTSCHVSFYNSSIKNQKISDSIQSMAIPHGNRAENANIDSIKKDCAVEAENNTQTRNDNGTEEDIYKNPLGETDDGNSNLVLNTSFRSGSFAQNLNKNNNEQPHFSISSIQEEEIEESSMIIKNFTAVSQNIGENPKSCQDEGEKDQISIYRSNEHEQRKISVNESSDYQEEEDAVYILSGVVDGFSPVLKTMSPSTTSTCEKTTDKKKKLKKQSSIGKIKVKNGDLIETNISDEDKSFVTKNSKSKRNGITSAPSTPKKQRKKRREGLKRSQSTGQNIGVERHQYGLTEIDRTRRVKCSHSRSNENLWLVGSMESFHIQVRSRHASGEFSSRSSLFSFSEEHLSGI